MTPSEISALGEALYGKRWQLPLARDLGTSYNVVHDWATGERKPSRRYREKLAALPETKRRELIDLIRGKTDEATAAVKANLSSRLFSGEP